MTEELCYFTYDLCDGKLIEESCYSTYEVIDGKLWLELHNSTNDLINGNWQKCHVTPHMSNGWETLREELHDYIWKMELW